MRIFVAVNSIPFAPTVCISRNSKTVKKCHGIGIKMEGFPDIKVIYFCFKEVLMIFRFLLRVLNATARMIKVSFFTWLGFFKHIAVQGIWRYQNLKSKSAYTESCPTCVIGMINYLMEINTFKRAYELKSAIELFERQEQCRTVQIQGTPVDLANRKGEEEAANLALQACELVYDTIQVIDFL